MSKGDIETYHEGGQWKNRAQGNSRASSVLAGWTHTSSATAELPAVSRITRGHRADLRAAH